MKDILLAPIESLYNLAFYRRVQKASLGRGFLYITFLSLISGVVMTFFFGLDVVPQAEDFLAWSKKNMPPIKFTREGAVTDVPQPFTLTHPRYGTLAVINTKAEVPPLEKMPDTLVYIAKTKALVRQRGRNEYRVYDIVPAAQIRDTWREFELNGTVLENLYRRLLPAGYAFAFVLMFVLFFLWKLLAGLFYSLVGLVVNLFRREKLGYASVLNVTFFAMTAVTLLQTLEFFFRVPVNFFTAFVVTSAYLFIGLVGAQDSAERTV